MAFSQTAISGIVVDSRSSKALPLVNISFDNEKIGTVTDDEGRFSLEISEFHPSDTLVFSRVGYKPFKCLIKFIVEESQLIRLEEVAKTLRPIQINSEKLVERKFGIKRRGLAFHFTDGILYEENAFEIGQLIKLKDATAQITSVNLYLFESKRDSVTFRVNFYRLEDGIPAERILDNEIIQKHPVTKGWLKLDLSDDDIILKGNFMVALELLPDEGKVVEKLLYEIKIGGSSRSYYRKNKEEEWKTPPHHYCMYVTALVDKSTPVESVEKESLPSETIWSEYVSDSFNIFLSFPNDYEKKKKRMYPVIYCLDANAYFDHIKRIVKDYIRKKELKIEPIIVGVGYDNPYLMDSLRVRDYTFPKAPPSDSLFISGGGKNFYNFFSKELIPYIDRCYRTESTNNTIIGHSFGGYFVNYSLLKGLLTEHQFRNYVAVSPSLWYADAYLVRKFKSDLKDERNPADTNLFMTIGEEELKFENDVYFESLERAITNIPSIEMESKIYPKLDHLGVAIPSYEDAVKYIFGNK